MHFTCPCEYMCNSVHGCTQLCTGVETGKGVGCPPLSLSTYSLEWDLSLKLVFSFSQTGWKPTGPSHPPNSSLRDRWQVCLGCPTCYIGVGIQTLVLMVVLQALFTTEPTPLPISFLFLGTRLEPCPGDQTKHTLKLKPFSPWREEETRVRCGQRPV